MKHNTIKRFVDNSSMMFPKSFEFPEFTGGGTNSQLFDVMNSSKYDISKFGEKLPSKTTKDYNTKMAINVPEDENVKTVNMGDCEIIDGTTKDHLLTYGLGPCVGVAIVIKSNSGKITRLLAHIDMGEVIGISIESLAGYIRKMKNDVSDGIGSVEVSLTSTQSYLDLKNLNENERELINVISTEFVENGITPENIKHNYSSQVQISPKGKITTYTKRQLDSHKDRMLEECIHEFGGYVEPNLNIYITQYGAWMTNCSLKLNSSEEEKNQYLKRDYFKEYIEKGYKLNFGPSFNYPGELAVYLENWRDTSLHKRGGIPGCIHTHSRSKRGDIDLGEIDLENATKFLKKYTKKKPIKKVDGNKKPNKKLKYKKAA